MKGFSAVRLNFLAREKQLGETLKGQGHTQSINSGAPEPLQLAVNLEVASM